MDSLRSIGNKFSQKTKDLSQGIAHLAKKPVQALGKFNYAHVAASGWLAARDMVRNSPQITTHKPFTEESLKNLLESQNNFTYELRLNQLNWDELSMQDWQNCFQTVGKELATEGPHQANAKKLLDYLVNDSDMLSTWKKDDLLGLLAKDLLDQYPADGSPELQEKFLANIEVFFEKILPLDSSVMGKLIGRLNDRHENDLRCTEVLFSLNADYNPKNILQNWLLSGSVNGSLRPYLDMALLGSFFNIKAIRTIPTEKSLYVNVASQGGLFTCFAGEALMKGYKSFKEKNLSANSAYASIAKAGFEKIDNFFQALSENKAQSPEDIAKRITNNQPVSFLINLPIHKMSITIDDGLLIFSNLGGTFSLQEGAYDRDSPFLGSLIFELPKPHPTFLNATWVKNLQNPKRNQVLLQEAIDELYNNLKPLGALSKRGQTRNNCVLDHHKVIIENFLLIAAYKDAPLEFDFPDEDTHGPTAEEYLDVNYNFNINKEKERFVAIRNHPVPIVNSQKNIKAARNLYRDITTDMRIKTLLNVVNQNNLIEVVGDTFSKEKKSEAKQWLLASVERATEQLFRFADQRFAKKSLANEKTTVETATFNTVHFENDLEQQPSLLKDLLRSNLAKDSLLARHVDAILEDCFQSTVTTTFMGITEIKAALILEIENEYPSGIQHQLKKLKYIQEIIYKDEAEVFSNMMEEYFSIANILFLLGKNRTHKHQLSIINDVVKNAIKLGLLSETSATLLVLNLQTDTGLPEAIQKAIQTSLVPIVQEFYTSDEFMKNLSNRVHEQLKTSIESSDEEEYLHTTLNAFHLLNRYKYEDYREDNWLNGLEKLFNPFVNVTHANPESEMTKHFLGSLYSFCLGSAPEQGCTQEDVERLFEKLFPGFSF